MLFDMCGEVGPVGVLSLAHLGAANTEGKVAKKR
jgi:hypothetical protein